MIKKNILISGAAGMIGSHLTKYFLDHDYNVFAFDNFSNVPEGRIKFIFGDQSPIVDGDILDEKFISSLLKNVKKIDFFFDLAYINGTKQFYSRPIEILSHAGRHVSESLKISRKFNCRWIYFSTPEVYGEPDIIPTPENHRILINDVSNLRFSYSIGKIYSESFIHSAIQTINGLDIIIVRPNNVYGPTDRFHVISDMLENFFSKSLFSVKGSGKETRSFCYIDDVVKQIFSVSTNGHSGETYNLGSDHRISINQLVDLLKQITGNYNDVVYEDLVKGSPIDRCPDLSNLKKINSYFDRSLIDGLKETFLKEQIFRNNLNK